MKPESLLVWRTMETTHPLVQLQPTCLKHDTDCELLQGQLLMMVEFPMDVGARFIHVRHTDRKTASLQAAVESDRLKLGWSLLHLKLSTMLKRPLPIMLNPQLTARAAFYD